MDIKSPAKSGTMESNDIYIMIQPKDNGGITIDLESIVMHQFGEKIREVILETLKNLEVENAHVVAKDRGALDCTIRARVETAVKRAM